MPERNPLVCACILKLDGKTVIEAKTGTAEQKEGQWYLESVEVDKELDAPDMFRVELHMRPGAQIDILDQVCEGQEVEILLGPVGSEKQVFVGEIHYIEPSFRYEGKSTLAIGGYDRTHRLTRGTQSRTWGDGLNPADLKKLAIQDIVQKASSYTGQSDRLNLNAIKTSDGPKVSYIPQLNVPDFQMLRALQSDIDASKAQGSPVVTIVRDGSLGPNEVLVHEAHFSLSTVNQYGRVEVRGWDDKRKKAIVGVATAPTHSFGGTPAPQATGKALYGSPSSGKVLTIVDRPVESQEEAEKLAKAIFNRLAMDFVTGDVDIQGDPRLKPGDLVELKGFGARFSGKYMVRKVTHLLIPRVIGYRTKLKIARCDVGEKK